MVYLLIKSFESVVAVCNAPRHISGRYIVFMEAAVGIVGIEIPEIMIIGPE